MIEGVSAPLAPQTASGDPQSVFPRGESWLAHAVYGLLLTMATVGELLRHEIPAWSSTGWLLGAGAVLFASHMFSDVLAQVTARRTQPDWSGVLRVSRHDAGVTVGAFGAALIMALAAVANLDAQAALQVCLVVGFVALGTLPLYATAHHGWWTRVRLSVGAVGLGAVIVLLENIL